MLGLYGVSGFCALAVETIWIRALSVRIGNTVETAILVLTCFFLCAALGNYWGSRVAPCMVRPLMWYGGCELAAAVATAVFFILKGPIYAPIHLIAASQIGVRLVYVLAVVGVPSFFAGGAFPALSEALVTSADRRAREGGAFYACNLMGAALGVIGGGILLPWRLGNGASLGVALVLQVGIGGAAILIGRKWSAKRSSEMAGGVVVDPLPLPAAFGYVVLVGSGILSLMLEMLVLCYFQQFTSASLYAMSAVLFAFIINLGVGSLVVSWLRGRGCRNERLLTGALTVSGLLLTAYPFVLQRWFQTGMLPPMESLAVWTVHAVMTATLLFAPVLIPVAMVFPLGWEVVERGNRCQGQALGRVMSMNKAACALGAFLGPFVLVPLVGLPGAMLSAGCVYIALACWAAGCLPVRRVVLAAVCVVVMSVLVLAFVHRPIPVSLGDGDRLLGLYQGPDGVVAVSRGANGSRHIVLNQTYTLNGTNRALLSQREECWLPLAMCEKPERVAFIGMASGISATAALDYPIRELTAIELVPDVVRAAHEHFGEWNGRLFADPRSRVVANDGRFVIQSSRENYDAIICDLFLPSLEGTTSLYSREFFEAERRALAPGGKCCLWLPMYQLDEEMAGTVLRTFSEVFPTVILVRGNFDPLQPTVGVIGSNEPIDLSDRFLDRRLKQVPPAARSGSPFLKSAKHLRLCLIGDLAAVKGDFEDSVVNTDDNQRFSFLGPKLIPHGEALRAFPLLNYLGRRFVGRGFPSCALGSTPARELEAGMNAGNYYFAASIMGAPIPGSMEDQLRRESQAAESLGLAQSMFPAAKLGQSDLGR